MTKPALHPKWEEAADPITDGFSLEITAKDVESLQNAAHLIPAGTSIAVTFLPGEEADARVRAAAAVRALGFEPMPHFSARRITSHDELTGYLGAVVEQAKVKRVFVIAGDPPQAEGPFSESIDVIRTGAFEAAGIEIVGIGGHPEGHPNMTKEQTFEVLKAKSAEIEARGMVPLIVTQFSFDPDACLDWLKELRARGIDAPVRMGIPGPASIKALLRFAARCGVGASASVMKKYGISLTSLIGSAGPDKLVNEFARRLAPEHGKVRLHFYPFGGLEKTAQWIEDYTAKAGR